MKTSKGHICKGCKNPLPCRTPGCQQCKWRHNYNVSIGKAPKRRRCCKTCGYAMIYRNPKCKTCKSREESNKKRGKPPLIRLTPHGPEPKPKKRETPDPHITEMPPGLAAYIRARRARLKKKISH